jgi:hypothetical protein
MEPVTQPTTIVSQTEAYTYPSLLTRVQSLLVDGLVIILLMFLAGKILDQYQETPDWVRAVLFFGFWAVYEPLAMTLGCTIGNYLLGVRVRQFKNTGKKLNILQAYVRFIVKFLLGWLSFIAIHFTPERRAMHDLASGSVMIKPVKEEDN